MTEIVQHQTPTPAALPVMQGDAVDLEAWAKKLAAARQIGSALASTAFVPAHFQGKPDDAAAAIMAGASLGLNPSQALEMFYVVHGRASMSARSMGAIAMRAGHEIEDVHISPTSVTVRARRKGKKEWQEFTWDLERAKQAGYTKNGKYQTNPIEMLRAKCWAEAVRTIAPDALAGMGVYSVEEIELEDLGEKPVPAAQPAPLEAPADAITAEDWAAITAEARDAGVPTPAALAQVVGHALGRKVTGWQSIVTAEVPAIRQAIADHAAPIEPEEA